MLKKLRLLRAYRGLKQKKLLKLEFELFVSLTCL